MKRAAVLIGSLTLLGWGIGSVDPTSTPVSFTDKELRRIGRHSPLRPPPADPTNAVADDPRAARFGQALFFDTRLSSNGELSCASCHDPKQGFADGLSVAEGLSVGKRNALSIWNAAYQRWLYWDGRADTMWGQAISPIEDERELGSSRLEVAHLIGGDAALRARYEAIFGPFPDISDAGRFPHRARPVPGQRQHPDHLAWTAMTAADRATVDRILVNATKSIAAYERRLISRRAPFDVFVAGLSDGDEKKLSALSRSAQRGLKLFISDRASCWTCHTGPTFTDGEFHNIGVPPRDGGLPRDPGRYRGASTVMKDPFNAAGVYSDDREGRRAARVRSIASSPDDWGRFKTPTLRNAALSPPYMHQGQLAGLGDVMEYYSTLEGAVQLDHHQEQILIPLELSSQERADLVAFIESLADEGVDPSLLGPISDGP